MFLATQSEWVLTWVPNVLKQNQILDLCRLETDWRGAVTSVILERRGQMINDVCRNHGGFAVGFGCEITSDSMHPHAQCGGRMPTALDRAAP